MQMITGIPLWVWPLFILLLVIGLNSTRNRKVPIVLYYLLPLLGFLPLRSVINFGPSVFQWLVFAICVVVGGVFGHTLQQRWIMSKADGRVHVSGELLTLCTLMTVFSLNFVKGFMMAVAPNIVQSQGFILAFIAIAALCLGLFSGRSLRVLRWQN